MQEAAQVLDFRSHGLCAFGVAPFSKRGRNSRKRTHPTGRVRNSLSYQLGSADVTNADCSVKNRHLNMILPIRLDNLFRKRLGSLQVAAGLCRLGHLLGERRRH